MMISDKFLQKCIFLCRPQIVNEDKNSNVEINVQNCIKSETNVIIPSLLKTFKCFNCAMNFTCKSALDNHIDSVHQGLHLFKCTECSKFYKSQKSMKQHIKIDHEMKVFHKCAVCDSTFKTRVRLKRHTESVHEGKKPYICTICNNSFKAKANLKQHIKVGSQ